MIRICSISNVIKYYYIILEAGRSKANNYYLLVISTVN